MWTILHACTFNTSLGAPVVNTAYIYKAMSIIDIHIFDICSIQC